ncbi:MAG TPA: subclass B3 metallo-beta-lactamase [Blastocatellia bacterium]|nr:subclass B3 metallo-beta-lactamase [Blastocatellia bacterium]
MRKQLVCFARRSAALLLLLAAPLTVSSRPQGSEQWREWNHPVKPFRVIGNVYYVGATEVSSFLITTPQGHILLDSGFAETVPQIRENVKQLGFKLEDIKLLINSHAHSDHAGGLAELKSLTGAKLYASEADAALLAAGGKGDFQWGDTLAFAPVQADRIIHDGETVELGGVWLVAHLTPGHTKGNTTWTMEVKEGGKTYNVVFMGSTTAPDYKLVNNAKYPNIVADYQRSFRVLESLPCDVFLSAHGSFFNLIEKMARLEKGATKNPFVDPKGYREFLENSKENFYKKLKAQQAKPTK